MREYLRYNGVPDADSVPLNERDLPSYWGKVYLADVERYVRAGLAALGGRGGDGK